MAYLGLLGGMALLIWLALRGVNIIFASIVCSLVVIISNGLPISLGLSEYYAFGPLGAFTFAGKFFLLFAAGAIFGRVMAESHAATSIALALVRTWGADRALWIATLSCALLTYGGVVVFVVIFAMYPLGLRLLFEANIPKRLFVAAVALGAGTFTLTAMPGTPSLHNVISSVGLGTDLYAGGWLGLLGGGIMFGLGMWYLERQRQRAIASGEIFVPGPKDKIADRDAESTQYPDWRIATLPLVMVLATIMLPRIFLGEATTEAAPAQTLVNEVLLFAQSQPILWPSIALIAASLFAVILFPDLRGRAMEIFGQGTNESVMPLFNTAAVIGFGGVVTHTLGFQQFTQTMVNSDLPPMLSMFTSISLVSGITGSSSGGLQIFMETMASDYLAMGIDPGVLHRLVTMASGGFDSLPHCGAVVAMLSIMGLSHKEGYKDIGVVTVAIPVAATAITMLLYAALL